MFECRYCGTCANHKDERGNCIACGAPKPKELQPEIQTVVVREYIYAPSGVYRPPAPTFRQQSYYTRGYKVMTFVTTMTTAILIAVFAYFWFFYKTNVPNASDPALRNMIPTAVDTATPFVKYDPWADTIWLGSEEALELRNQPQVINLAYLDRGGADYASFSYDLGSDYWKEAAALGIKSISVYGTAFSMEAYGEIYYLNLYQPFVFPAQPDVIYLVDENGMLRSADRQNLTQSGLDSAIQSLPFEIAPNPKLTTTH